MKEQLKKVIQDDKATATVANDFPLLNEELRKKGMAHFPAFLPSS
ncbi:hypothetical protein BH11VER1_BH11VER1_41040 [soil metagenome]